MRRGRDGDELASTDEVKVYKYEDDDENRASENLIEDKLGLVNETEEVRRFVLLLHTMWSTVLSVQWQSFYAEQC